MSTPSIGLKRKLAEHFKVYLIDEYNTSKINSKGTDECENISVTYKKTFKPESKEPAQIPLQMDTNEKTLRKQLHSVLSFKMNTGEMGCINRDRNSVINWNFSSS